MSFHFHLLFVQMDMELEEVHSHDSTEHGEHLRVHTQVDAGEPSHAFDHFDTSAFTTLRLLQLTHSLLYQ